MLREDTDMPNPADDPVVGSLYTAVLDQIKELLPYNYIGGLITSNDADADHDVAIAPGECRGLADDASLRLASILTKQIDAVWAAGDDAGGLDAAPVVAASTLYAIWLIKDTDGTVDALFSLSFTAPTMPGTYNRKRLIGSVMTEGAANIIAYTQSGDYFRYMGDIILDVNDNTINPITVFEVGTLSVPPSCLAHIYGALSNPTSTAPVDGYLSIKTNGAADGIPPDNTESFALIKVAANFDNVGVTGMVLVDSASQIQYAAVETTGSAQVLISTIGFTMLTRREP